MTKAAHMLSKVVSNSHAPLNRRIGKPIDIDVSRCTGCLICQMRCSLRFEKAFNPTKAAIQINRLVNQPNEFEVIITDKCDRCGICVIFCPYAALHQQE